MSMLIATARKALRRIAGCKVARTAAPKPITASTTPPAKRIARKFVKKSSSAPIAFGQFAWLKEMPTTESGGTNEIAIATPGSESDTSRATMRVDAPTGETCEAVFRRVGLRCRDNRGCSGQDGPLSGHSQAASTVARKRRMDYRHKRLAAELSSFFTTAYATDGDRGEWSANDVDEE